MMATPRKQQISLEDTPYYHCVARCVRRAFLCGEDKYSGQSYEHRRGWVEDKLHFLTQVFAIDVCAYAVMSNHYHVVVFIDEVKAKQWSMIEVLERWHTLYKGTLLTKQYCQGEALAKPLLDIVKSTAKVYRKRLMKISWFMGYINEGIARAANQEDDCKGRFWEGRFKSQALLDEAVLASCMAYVDLNPIRVNAAQTPENSEHTSIKLRCEQAEKSNQPSTLLPFIGNPIKGMPKGLPFELKDYVKLIELTGRCIREAKSGFIEESQPAILNRLNISPENWLIITTEFNTQFHGAIGHEIALSDYCQHQQLKRRQNLSHCKQLFS
jgi:REP element-mobilizing transposase RayT